jgi:hypothetical protein
LRQRVPVVAFVATVHGSRVTIVQRVAVGGATAGPGIGRGMVGP